MSQLILTILASFVFGSFFSLFVVWMNALISVQESNMFIKQYREVKIIEEQYTKDIGFTFIDYMNTMDTCAENASTQESRYNVLARGFISIALIGGYCLSMLILTVGSIIIDGPILQDFLKGDILYSFVVLVSMTVSFIITQKASNK